MTKKWKTLIAEKKLTDDQIHEALLKFTTADSSDADEEDQNEENTADDDSADEENQTGEEDAPKEEQPDIRAIIREMLTEELKAMKGGKPAPKPKKTKNEPKQIYKEFGVL